MRRLFAILVLAVFAAPAAACINDFGLSASEREFRSNYQGGDKPGESTDPMLRYAVGGVGWVFLLGATAVTLRRQWR